MHTLSMCREATLSTLPTVFLAQRQHVTTVTAPIGTDVRKLLESMRNPMIDLLLIWIGLCVRLADALCNDARITFRMAGVLAVLALHTRRIFEKLATQRTTHDIVELLRHELVSVHLVHNLFALANGTLSVKPEIEWTAVVCLLEEA